MKRSLTLLTMVISLVLPLALTEAAPARAPARVRAPVRARRPPKPKLLVTVEKVEVAQAAQPAPRLQPRLRAALDKALAAEPLVITGLGLKKPTPGRTAWALRRRRLRWYGVTLRLESVTHKVVTKGPQKHLVAEAVVTLSGKRKERLRKGTFAVKSTGKVSTPVSVVLQGEVLASRLAAVRAALGLVVRGAVTQVTGKKIRRRRRGR